MTQQKNTPTPWLADECKDSDGFITIRRWSDDGNGDIHEQPIATVFSEVDAALIVKSANHHHDMLAALRRLSAAAFGRETIMGDPSSLITAKAEVSAALKQAREVIAKIETA